MLDNIILGLLLFKKLSVYDLKKALDEYVCFFYSSSYGNIIPTLRKLEKSKAVTVNETVVNGRNRKEYTITAEGRKKFKLWLSKEISIGKTQNEALLRLFFLTELPAKERIKLLQDYSKKLKENIVELKAIESETKKMQIPVEYKEPFNYRVITLDFGIKYYEFELSWYNNIIKKIKNNEL
jgi:DNA-binding PadR family transcriptional regulator